MSDRLDPRALAQRNPFFAEVGYCLTCEANTSVVAVCPFCGADVDAAADPICATCAERVAPLLVCEVCGTERPRGIAPAQDRPAARLSPRDHQCLREYTQQCLRAAERQVPIPTACEIPDDAEPRYRRPYSVEH